MTQTGNKFALLLYRNILREHRNRLPATMRALGDDYIKKEFRLHKAAKEEHVKVFMSSWTSYLTTLRRQQGRFGMDMDTNIINSLGDEQKSKLDGLREESRNAFVGTKGKDSTSS